MIAPTIRVRSAIQFAEAAAALGWEVKRKKLEDGDRQVSATRGAESFVFVWEHDDETNKDIFIVGYYYVNGQEQVWKNVAKALRHMEGEPDNISTQGERIVRLPFDPFTADDKAVLDALAGKTVTWTNTLSGADDYATLPARGKQTKLEYRYGEALDHRTLTFAAVDSGFRSVRLCQLVGVS